MDSTDKVTSWFSHRLVSFSIELNVSDFETERVQKISLHDESHQRIGTNSSKSVLSIGIRISNFLDGNHDDFKDLKLDFSGLSRFQTDVLETARTIERGRVVTYSELAEMAGYPDAVRATASVMKANRFPLIIPCHRVVRKDGSSGGYCGKQSGPMFELKQLLQQMEQMNRI
jgi:methylated-DNA-[protein]-cysteine S-methyltransferase